MKCHIVSQICHLIIITSATFVQWQHVFFSERWWHLSFAEYKLPTPLGPSESRPSSRLSDTGLI